MEFKDYYATLGVPKTASEADIKKAYRKLARENHPDLNAGNKGAEARFKEINEANEVLSNPDSRKKYDELGANWRAYEQSDRGAGGQSASWAGPFAQGTGGYRTVTPEEMHEMFGDDDPFSDFFHRFFGGSAAGGATGRGRPAPARRGADFESEVDLTLEDAFQGATRRLRLEAAGRKTKTVEVRIPAGVTDGARVRVAGEGEAAPKGGSSGDLFLRVHIQPHPRFEREGADLRTHVAVPVSVAVLGGEVPVTTLSGSTLRLKIPPLTPSGRRLRLRGQGMPTVGAGAKDGRGDLYATIDITMPAALTDEAREHYEALRKLEQS